MKNAIKNLEIMILFWKALSKINWFCKHRL